MWPHQERICKNSYPKLSLWWRNIHISPFLLHWPRFLTPISHTFYIGFENSIFILQCLIANHRGERRFRNLTYTYTIKLRIVLRKYRADRIFLWSIFNWMVHIYKTNKITQCSKQAHFYFIKTRGLKSYYKIKRKIIEISRELLKHQTSVIYHHLSLSVKKTDSYNYLLTNAKYPKIYSHLLSLIQTSYHIFPEWTPLELISSRCLLLHSLSDYFIGNVGHWCRYLGLMGSISLPCLKPDNVSKNSCSHVYMSA